jgi:2-iminoacetate synthase ThiH
MVDYVLEVGREPRATEVKAATADLLLTSHCDDGIVVMAGTLHLTDECVTTAEYLRTMATARLFLDNFVNIQASWVTQGPKVGAASLAFGVNDMGSTMIEENVVSAAGTAFHMSEPDIVAAVRDAGFIPRRRNMLYERLPAPHAGA